MKVKSESEVTQSCPTPSDPMDCSLPGSSIHGICQARILEWGAIAFSELSHWGSQIFFKTGKRPTNRKRRVAPLSKNICPSSGMAEAQSRRVCSTGYLLGNSLKAP